ncbi:hypothetical protein ACWCPS_34950 [Streptomyces mauvecolor]
MGVEGLPDEMGGARQVPPEGGADPVGEHGQNHRRAQLVDADVRIGEPADAATEHGTPCRVEHPTGRVQHVVRAGSGGHDVPDQVHALDQAASGGDPPGPRGRRSCGGDPFVLDRIDGHRRRRRPGPTKLIRALLPDLSNLSGPMN